ncbi:hypothetical protein LDENG_00223960, partial [Lucifuga dentata]
DTGLCPLEAAFHFRIYNFSKTCIATRKRALTCSFFGVFRCFGNALGNCIQDKEYLKSINKIPKQPPPPLDPAWTKRSDGEPSVEKARFSSLVREEKVVSEMGSARMPLEPRILNLNHRNGTEERMLSSADPASDKKSENFGSRSMLDSVDAAETCSDPKQLRKLRQQQLQQKFRQEMEVKKLQQKQADVKPKDAEVSVGKASDAGSSFTSSDDPELWDFTLDGIEELDLPAGSSPPRGLSTPNNHQMQTRSKTPQRDPALPPRALIRPPNEALLHSRGQGVSQYRPQHQHQYRAAPGRAHSPYRQGQHMKKRRLDT